MLPITSVKLLLQESLKGNFQNVFNNIISKNVSVDSHDAIKIIVALCNFCYTNIPTPENVNEADLGDLAKCVLRFIQVPSNEEYQSYAQSIFYILKLLIEKKNYDCIIELREMFIPEFMPLQPTDKHFSVYQSICTSIYNVIVEVAQSKEKTHTKRVFQLSYLLSDLYKKLGKKKVLFECGHNCILALITLEALPDELLKFYQHVTVDQIEDLSLYPSIINNFSLMYSHLLKNEEYTLAHQCYKFTKESLKILFKGKEYVLLADLMTIVDWINPVNIASMSPQTPIQAHTCLKNYYKQWNSTPDLQCVCDLISSVAFTVLQLYKKSNRWSENMEVHSHFYKFMNDVAVIMSKTVYPCHCKNCTTKTNLNETLRTLNTVGGFGRLYITSKEETSRTYQMEILRYLEKYLDYVIVLKENRCEKWKKYWYNVGVHLYLIGIHLYQKKNTEMFILYLQKFVQSLLELEGFQPILVEKTYLASALNAIADSYYESHDYEKCLLVTALSIIVSDSPKSEINRWMRAKAASRESTIEENRQLQEVTLVSVCAEYRSELETYLPKTGLQLTTKRKIELLVYELRQYNAKWKSKIPMSAVFGQLSKIANTQLCAEVFIEIWGDGGMLVHETLPKLLQDTIKRVELEEIPKKDILLAHLYFLQHKYRVKDAIVKHCDEMERTMNIAKASQEATNGLAPDPDDECDLVSSYECLKLNRYVLMMKELNKSLDLIHYWVSKHTEDCPGDRLYKLLSNIGHEFRLHDHTVNSLQAWELALKVAKTPLHKLEATGFIIEMSDVRKFHLEKIIQEAEEGVEALIAAKNLEELIVYFLCKTEAYFYVNFDIAQAAFRQALQLHQEHQGSGLLRARIHAVQHRFNMLPCDFELEIHREHSLLRIHLANNAVNAYYNETSSISSYDMRIFFDIYEALVKMYHDLRLPREVRCYAKDAVVIAQKMLLPLRTISFLYYLACADIRTCRWDDCRVKIRDFSDILGLTKWKNSVSTPTQIKDEQRADVEVLTGRFNEMMLDVPARVRSDSPTFAVETFKFPSFLNHEDSCECFYCTSIEYHIFVLKKTYLEAFLSECENNPKVALDYYLGCRKIYECLKKRAGLYSRKMVKKISLDLVPDTREKIFDTYCVILLEYGNFLIRNERHADAESANEKLREKMKPYKLPLPYLYNEVLLQTLTILARSPPSERVHPEMSLLSVDVEDTNVKTPLSQQSKVLIPPTQNQSGSKSVAKLQPKSLKFDLSDSEEEITENKGAVLKKLPAPLSNLGAKTPAPSTSKIQIYTNKSSKKPKALVTKIPSFKEPHLKGPALESTPSASSKVDDHLASRTKLLTERLRNSTRKRTTSATDENAKSGAKRGVRQNLMNQLDDADDGEKDGVRRSARNRK